MSQDPAAEDDESPYTLARRRAHHFATSPRPPPPAQLLAAVNPSLLPPPVLAALQDIVAVAERECIAAALARVEPLEAQTGKAFEYHLARLSLLSAAAADTHQVTERLERDVSHAFAAAKQLLRRAHPVLARDLLARILPFAPIVLVVKGDDARRSTAALISLYGLALQDLGASEEALETYRLALSLLDPGAREHQTERATILTNIGALHQEIGEYDLSSAALDEAVTLCRGQLPDNAAGLVVALTNRSQSEDYRGRRAAADNDWREANEIIERHGLALDAEIMTALLLQASHLLDARRWRDGAVVLRTAWRGACRAKDAAIKAEIIAVAAQAALRAELYAHAIRWFSEAVVRLEALAPDHAEQRIDAKRSMARAFNLADQPDDALGMCRLALDDSIASLGPHHPQTADTHRQMAQVLWQLDRFDEGEAHIRTAISILRPILTEDHPKLMASDGELAEHLLQRGADREAIDLLCDCIEREDRALRRLIDARSDLLDTVEMRMANGQLQLLLLAAARNPDLDSDRLRAIMDVRLRFGGSGLAILKSGAHALPAASPVLPTLMGPDVVVATSAVYDADGETRRALLLATTDATRLLVLGPARDLERDVTNWAEAPDETPGAALNAFIDALVDGIARHRRLVWLPDHALSGCPVAPLPIGAGRRLLDLVAVVQPRDAHCMIESTRRPLRGATLLIGVSTFDNLAHDDDLDTLPGVHDELSRVRSVYGSACTTLVDGDAHLDAVLGALGEAPDVVHIATHGLCGNAAPMPGTRGGVLRRRLDSAAGEDPLQRCALVLGGSSPASRLLTARHLAHLDLGAVSLAVLSACDTGVGRADAAEGVLGFQAALHHAGIATVVTSLWPVDDTIAPQFMEDFHAALRDGAQPSEALRHAQLRWSGTNSPLDWGGITISGCDAPLVSRVARSSASGGAS